MENKLLTRDEFRKAVFKRDDNKCVICGQLAQDAHHIMERRLFPDGGYYLDNGASLCGKCHLDAEATLITCEQLREIIGISKPIIPPQLYRDEVYDKWGNTCLSNGQRMRGELFDDESVKKALFPVLRQFTKYVKFPRTYHTPWSEGVTKNDRVMPLAEMYENFCDKEIIVSVKMDGENTTMYNDYIHARSIDGRHHPSRDWVKNLHSQIKYDIPEGWRICGENLFAKHSIHYKNLETYFLVFSIWNEKNVCLDWDTTVEWASLLGLQTVPIIKRTIFTHAEEVELEQLEIPGYKGDECEGYVIRLAEAFPFSRYRKSVMKYVRKNHIQTTQHWFWGSMTKNEVSNDRS